MKIFNLSNRVTFTLKKKHSKPRVDFTTKKVVENNKTYTVKVYTTETKLKSVGFEVYKPIVYYYKGKIHRELGPAIEGFDVPNRTNPVKVWVKNGKLHNDFGPAVKLGDGSYVYYRLGKMHRIGELPALESDEVKKYFINGKLHRENGPAVEYKNESQSRLNEFWINGIQLPKEAQLNYDRKRKLDDILDGGDVVLEMKVV